MFWGIWGALGCRMVPRASGGIGVSGGWGVRCLVLWCLGVGGHRGVRVTKMLGWGYMGHWDVGCWGAGCQGVGYLGA